MKTLTLASLILFVACGRSTQVTTLEVQGTNPTHTTAAHATHCTGTVYFNGSWQGPDGVDGTYPFVYDNGRCFLGGGQQDCDSVLEFGGHLHTDATGWTYTGPVGLWELSELVCE